MCVAITSFQMYGEWVTDGGTIDRISMIMKPKKKTKKKKKKGTYDGSRGVEG